MKTILHKANTRGHADHGWLKSSHTFSFAGYANPERVHFGALRVLNDDHVEGGNGFGTHPHDNMEIISIPLEGKLAHKDSMGNSGTIEPNEIQVMSAGTGVRHSEFNGSDTEPVKFLQIWIFPNKRNVTPRYDQIRIDPADRKNGFQQIISPDADDEGTWIYQDAWFHLADMEEGKIMNYTLKGKNSGLYVFVLEGQVDVAGELLERRDGLAITDTPELSFSAKQNSSLLLMEVPLSV
ncbi:MAG TPA: pirin family protein [Sphingobacterium sp.]|nr:pirin family protein [Sphingobacterium sp.]